MKKINSLVAAASLSCLVFSCQKNLDPGQDTQKDGSVSLEKKNGIAGYVYTLNNQMDNKVMIYSRTAGGMIDYVSAVSTGGEGTSAGLGSQGALALSEDNKWMVAVNAGNNTISSFAVDGSGLQWVSTVPSGGTTPISVTMHNNFLYVLNGGGSGNISGFTLDAGGSLHAMAGSTKPLSSGASGPAQVSFVADGSAVAITEKATNKIITYTINAQGMPGSMHMIASAHPTPFGFAVGKNGMIYVSEADGGNPMTSAVSSYHVSSNGSISHTGGPVFADQTAACWVVITNNGKYAYATNTGSNTVTSYGTKNGSLSLAEAVAAPTGTTPIDAALSTNSKFLYVLNAGSHSISGYEVANDGSLNATNTAGGLPAGTVGLAAK